MVLLRNILAFMGVVFIVLAIVAYTKFKPMLNLYQNLDQDTQQFVQDKMQNISEMDQSEIKMYEKKIKQMDPKSYDVYINMMKDLLQTGNSAEATVWKFPVEEGLSVEDVEDAMKTVANELNFANVGFLPLSKDIEAKTGQKFRHVSIYLYCDSLIASKMISYSGAYSAYLPCRISLIEDEQGKYWLYTLNMDMMIYGGKTLPPKLMEEALKVKEIILEIMKRGAKGEF